MDSTDTFVCWQFGGHRRKTHHLLWRYDDELIVGGPCFFSPQELPDSSETSKSWNLHGFSHQCGSCILASPVRGLGMTNLQTASAMHLPRSMGQPSGVQKRDGSHFPTIRHWDPRLPWLNDHKQVAGVDHLTVAFDRIVKRPRLGNPRLLRKSKSFIGRRHLGTSLGKRYCLTYDL